MSNRFEKPGIRFLDLAISVRKQAQTFLDDVDRVIDWRIVEKFLKKKLRRHKDAVGNPAYPALSMFKVQGATFAALAQPQRPRHG